MDSLMAADPPGTTKILSDSRAEVLQSLVSTLAPRESASAEIPSKEDVSKLSDKLKELLGDVDPSPDTVVQRNEKGELQNEEGLPIVEITEPMDKVPEPASGASSGTGPTADTEHTGFVPMYQLPPAERARNRAQMGRILDMLEEEERIEEERHKARDREQRREELELRRGNVKAEMERVKTAKEMQKKMGKALLRNMADAREKEEKEKERQEREDMEKEEERRSRKPRKCVSWAELPKLERSDDDAAIPNLPGRLPMRPYVVERFPARSGASSSPPPIPMGDSDDESEPPSSVPSDSDTPSRIPSDGIPFPTPEHDQSDVSEDEDEPLESHGSEDGFDIDSIQHQREIALAYFEKRNTIGADAARAMSAHSHNLDGDENDCEQEDVPLDALLSDPRPKPSQSKFKSERIAQAYFGETQLPSSTPPTSLGTSAVLPNSTSGALRSAMRIGRLEGSQLVGNSDSDREDDEDDEAVRTREFMDVLRRGDVTNAGAADNSDALIAALETAYGAPTKQPHTSVQAHLTAPPPTSATPSENAAPPPKKGSRFKLERAVPPPTIAEDEGLREGGADMAEHGTTLSATSQPSPSSAPTRFVDSLPVPVPDTSASQSSMMIIDSPSFATPPPGGAPMTTTIIDSPSFQKPQFPLPSAKPVRPSSRPPTVLSSVRESSGMPRQQETPAHEPEKKVSRFKAQRTET